MPANLTPDYLAAEERYRAARDDEERLACLIEMLALLPKHKGTEKLQADIKARISRLRKASHSRTGGPRRSNWYQIPRQGAGQVTLFGAPNTGKSSIVAALTGARTSVGPYPFATTVPQAGMMPFEDIWIQLVDTPPIYRETEPWVYHLLRTADLLLMVLDLGDDDIIRTTEEVVDCLAHKNIFLPGQTGTPPDSKPRRTLVAACKADSPGAEARQAIAAELLGPELLTIAVSTTTCTGLEELRCAIFRELQIIRVYTKRPGHPPDMSDPVVLPVGSTVIEAAGYLHKELAARLRYARLWDCDRFHGQMVERNHILTDRSIVEYHT